MEVFVLLRLMVIGSFASSLALAATDYDRKITDARIALGATEKRISELQDKIEKCKGVEFTNYSETQTVGCSGFLNFSSKKDLAQMKADLETARGNAVKIRAEIDGQRNAKDLSAASKMELNGKAIDAQLLLADFKTAELSLKNAGVDIQALNSKFDQSILGNYTKYAIENSMKSSGGQQMICKAVSTCSDTKKANASLLDMDKKMQSFEQFRKAQLELLKKAETSRSGNGAAGTPAAGGAVTN